MKAPDHCQGLFYAFVARIAKISENSKAKKILKAVLEPVKTIEIYQKSPSPQAFKAGETIFSLGDPGDLIYGVIQGEVEFWIDGKVVETICQGDLFGEGSLVHVDHHRFETAIAKTDCLLAFLDRHHFLFVIEQTPRFALEVMRSYSDRLRQLKQTL